MRTARLGLALLLLLPALLTGCLFGGIGEFSEFSPFEPPPPRPKGQAPRMTSVIGPAGGFSGGYAQPEPADVQALVGLPGRGSTFYPEYEGSDATAWSWDFGGGAEPNTSSAEYPAVTPLGPGVYNGSVTVTNAHGSDTYSFTLTVELPIRPAIQYAFFSEPDRNVVAQLTAGNDYSFEAGLVLDSAFGPQGDVRFDFDFGGGCAPNTSRIDPESIHTIQTVTAGAPGSYTCIVTATNARGSTTIEREYTVVP